MRRPALFLIGLVCGLVAAFLVGLLVLAPLALTHKDSSPIETLYGDLAVNLVSSRGATTLPAATSQAALANGRAAYEASCAECHGSAGDGKGAFGTNTFPPATDLTSSQARSKSDAQLFRIIKNGLGLTAMPRYASQYQDEDIAALVGYIRGLQHG
jgi:mono/diheme cytochrome c family protein